MTIETSLTKTSYLGNNSAREWPLPFPVLRPEHIHLMVTDTATGLDTAVSSGYTVTGCGTQNVNVMYPTSGAALPSGQKLTIYRLVPYTQQLDLENGGAFDAEVIEGQFDIVVMQLQQLQEQLDRTVMVGINSDIEPAALLRTLEATRAACEAAAQGTAEDKQAAQEAAQEAMAAAQAALDMAGSLEFDSFLHKDSPGPVHETLSLPMPEATDAMKRVRIRADGQGYEYVDPDPSPRIRNLILSGRERDGMPAYIVPGYGEFLNMEHEAGQKIGATGVVDASGYRNSTYPPEYPVVNQIVSTGYSWASKASETEAWWQYTFKKQHALSAMYIQFGQATQTPKRVSVSIKSGNDWQVLYDNPNWKQYNALNGTLVSKPYGITVWFAHNNVASDTLRVILNGFPSGGQDFSVMSIRFFERAATTDLHKFDAALVASPAQPFRASIACGDTGDHSVALERDVVINGHTLAEMSRNHIYIVPEATAGTCPGYVRQDKAVHLPEARAYLVPDLRKVNHGSKQALKKQCLAALQSRETQSRAIAAAETIAVGAGAWAHKISAQSISIDATEKPRGAASAYAFVSGASLIYIPAELETSFKDKMAQAYPGSRDFTVELDFKYGGPAPETDDEYRILFDSGYSEVTPYPGMALAYYHRRGQLAVFIRGVWFYAVPYVADDKWHTVSLSRRADKIFFHVDGKCLGFYDACPPIKVGHNRWALGRWLHGDARHWRGHLANFRYIIGDCLRQNEDYEVPAVFNTHVIPDKTLWWNSRKGTVQEWHADTETWFDAPLLAVGHIDTGNKEHLHTEAPRGTQGSYDVQAVVSGSYATNGQHSASYPSSAILNFADGGTYAYITAPAAANNTTAYWVSFKLEQALSFAELRLANSGVQPWYSDPCIFRWEGSNDGNTWTTLVDRSAYVRDGSISMSVAHFLGSVHNINSMKRFAYADATPYTHYRITFLPKGAVPFHAGYFTACRLQLPLRDAKPEITACASYVIGDTFTYGPTMLSINSEYTFPVPFGGAEFDVDGYVVEKNDWQNKGRKLGQMLGWYDSRYFANGEIVYTQSDAITIVTGNYQVSLLSGTTWNSPTVNAASTTADLTLICKRIA